MNRKVTLLWCNFVRRKLMGSVLVCDSNQHTIKRLIEVKQLSMDNFKKNTSFPLISGNNSYLAELLYSYWSTQCMDISHVLLNRNTECCMEVKCRNLKGIPQKARIRWLLQNQRIVCNAMYNWSKYVPISIFTCI